jgi:hypothetical protein
MPDVIEQWRDKQLWRFRINYQSYLGSLEGVDPECDSELMKDKFPHKGEDYLSVKRKIEAHAAALRGRFDVKRQNRAGQVASGGHAPPGPPSG